MRDDVLVLLVLAASTAAYASGLRRLWAHAGRGRVVHPSAVAAFTAGQAVAAAVLVGPIGRLSASMLWAHMVQHLALVAVAAPLLVAGAPLPTLLWALPDGRRAAVARLWRRLNRSQAGPRWGAWAVAAVGLHTAALWSWHVPGLYDAAARHPALHLAQHASFVGTGLLFWWTVAAAARRATVGLGVLAVFVVALQGIALGALLTMSATPWYSAYAGAGHGAGLTPLEDQQVAGVIMWCPGGFAYVAAAAVLLFTWLLGEDRAHPARGSLGAGLARARP